MPSTVAYVLSPTTLTRRVAVISDTANLTPRDDEPRELIKGINGLAEFLGCGSTKAQNIMNSGILQERDIAYRAGNRWRFNKTLLTRLLDEEPEILNRVCSEAEAA